MFSETGNHRYMRRLMLSLLFVLAFLSCGCKANTDTVLPHADGNPYHAGARVMFVVGDEFATLGTYMASDGTSVPLDGIVGLAGDGETVKVPKVETKAGYEFLGWSYGGVQEAVDVAPDVSEVLPNRENANGHSTTSKLYGLFKDTDGNVYCSCGDYAAADETSLASAFDDGDGKPPVVINAETRFQETAGD